MSDSNYRAKASSTSDEEDDRTLRERLERGVALAMRAVPFWKGTLGIFLVASGIGLFMALRTERIYRSECKILVKSGIRTGDRNDSPTLLADKVAARLKEVLLTRTRLEPIIKDNKLYEGIVEGKGMTDAVEEMRTHVGLRASAESTFTISFEDTEKERTRAVTQQLTDTTIADYKRSNLSKAEQEVEFYSAQATRAQEDLAKAETALYGFHALHPEFPVAIMPSGMGVGMQPTTVRAPQTPPDPILADLYKRKAQIEAEAKIDGKPVVATTSAEVSQAQTARDEAQKRLVEAKAALNEKSATLTDQHPDVAAAKSKVELATTALKAAEAQLDKARGAQAQPIPSAALSTESQTKLMDLNKQIGSRLDELKRNSPTLGSTAAVASSTPVADWQRFTSEVNIRRIRYEDLQRNLKEKELEARASKGSELLEVLEPAFLPSHPYRGGRTKTALFGLAFALVLALGYALVRVLFDDTIIDAEDVRSLHRTIPVIGVIPSLPSLPPNPSPSEKG